jgi:hypothetical protein
MGIHSIQRPVIVRDFKGSPIIANHPIVARRQIIRVLPPALPQLKEPPRGFLASLAQWIRETVKSIFERSSAPTEKNSVVDDLRLTTSDKFHTAFNTVHWGIALCGVSPQLAVPINLLASLGADTLSFLSLPKDASWLRKLFSLPGVAKAIINYNPWIAKISQITSLFNHVEHSTHKLAAVCSGFKTHPKEALKAGFAHLFNLASSVAFTAESFGLIHLHKEESTPQRCLNQSGVKPTQCKRKIVSGSAYFNEGDPMRDRYSKLVDSTHAEYAKRWGAEHVVHTDASSLKGRCRDPRTVSGLFGFNRADCSPYWLKIPMLKEWLEEPRDPNFDEEWRIFFDDDMPVTNMNIDPNDVIDSLRAESGDTSVILAKDPHQWFPNDRVAINTGLILVRKDAKALEFMNRVWDTRQMLFDLDNPHCPTLGLCKNQDSLHEQQGMGIALDRDLSLIDRVVTIVPPRDEQSARKHIALNTFYGHDNQCYLRQRKGWIDRPYIHNLKSHNPNAIWKKGDWTGQTAAVPVWGKRLPMFGKNKNLCVDLTPLDFSEVRHDTLQEMIDQTVR